MTRSDRAPSDRGSSAGEPQFPLASSVDAVAIDLDDAAFLDDDTDADPRVIDWDTLPAEDYESALEALATWVDWFATTYQVPATVVPPCWPEHPGLREDLGHLWTGWLTTRHPNLGVGMIGLDWDARRDQALPRLRAQTALAGCTPGRHTQAHEPSAAHSGDPLRKTPRSR